MFTDDDTYSDGAYRASDRVFSLPSRTGSETPFCNNGRQNQGRSRDSRYNASSPEQPVKAYSCKPSPTLSSFIPFTSFNNTSSDSPSAKSDQNTRFPSSRMKSFGSSIFGMASSVTDGYIHAASGRQRGSVFSISSNSLSGVSNIETEPRFVVPRRTTPPRGETLTSKAELISFLKGNNPKGFHEAIAFDLYKEEKMTSSEELYRKQIREEISAIDFKEVKTD